MYNPRNYSARPKDWKNSSSSLPPGLKVSSSIVKVSSEQDLPRALGPSFGVECCKVEIESFDARLKLSSEIENSKQDWILYQAEGVASMPAWMKSAFGTLVAESSATGVTVAAIPPCSAIRFRNPKVPRYPEAPPAHRAPCLLRMRGKCDRGVRRKVRHLDLGGGGVARFWRDISDSAGI